MIKNIIKYTIGLPFLIIISLFFILLIIIDILLWRTYNFIFFLLKGNFDDIGEIVFLKELINLWKPI